MNAKKLFLGGLLWGMCAAVSVAAPVTNEGNIVLPTKAQADWQRKECIMFVHYGPAAFQGREYATGRAISAKCTCLNSIPTSGVR